MTDSIRLDWLEANFATVEFRPDGPGNSVGHPWVVTGYRLPPSRGESIREAIDAAKNLGDATAEPKPST